MSRYLDILVYSQVTAHDKDCTPKKSDICKYEIVTSDVGSGNDRDGPEGEKPAELPFQIDPEGNIRNTRPLSYEESHNYIFEVRVIAIYNSIFFAAMTLVGDG